MKKKKERTKIYRFAYKSRQIRKLYLFAPNSNGILASCVAIFFLCFYPSQRGFAATKCTHLVAKQIHRQFLQFTHLLKLHTHRSRLKLFHFIVVDFLRFSI